MSKNRDTYSTVKTFTYPNAIVRVHFPDLTEEERARRMKIIEKAAADLIKSAIEGRKKKASLEGGEA